MTTTQSIFVVFFAIFWGCISSVQGRWKMFQWPLISYQHVAARVILSFLLLNIFPIIFFAFIFFLLRNTPITPPSQWTFFDTLRQVVAGVVPAFSVFGFYRFWLAFVEFWPECFYQHEENQDARMKKVEPNLEKLDLGQDAWGNLIFSLLYLLGAAMAAWLLGP